MKRSKDRKAPALLAAFAAGALALPAGAFQPLVTDDTGTQGERGNQLELSIDGDRAKAAGEAVRTRTVPFTYTRGLTDTLDVFAGISSIRVTSSIPGVSASGGGNPVLGAKWRFFEDEDSKTSLALKPEIVLPVSEAREANGLGSGRTSWALTLIATREVGFGAVHANLATGQNRFRNADVPDSTVVAFSIAPVWDVAPMWKLALDVGYEQEKAGGLTVRSRFAEVGAIYSPSEDLDFALGFISSRNSTDPRVTTESATLGVTWRFR